MRHLLGCALLLSLLATGALADEEKKNPRVIDPASTGFSPTAPFGINEHATIRPATSGFSPTSPFDLKGTRQDSATTGFSPTTPFKDNHHSVIQPASHGFSPTTPFGAPHPAIRPASHGFSPTNPFGVDKNAIIAPASSGFSPTMPYGIQPRIESASTGHSSSDPFHDVSATRSNGRKKKEELQRLRAYDQPLNETSSNAYPGMTSYPSQSQYP
jgi:hypothetical protein